METFAPYEEPYSSVVVWPEGLPFPEDAESGERRFDLRTWGPWGQIVKIRGLAVAKSDRGITIFGDRNLGRPREDGYVHRGYVSVGGKNRRAFTASQLFRYQGKLYDFGILYVTKGE
jgi:hypothetical protein